jgi:branched-chain amino acid transport system permease protein
MFISLALSWNILGGYAGYLSFGHMSFFGIGAYTTAILMRDLQLSPFVTVPLGSVSAGLVSIIMLSVFIKLEEAYFAIATLALNFALLSLAVVLEITGGPRGISIPIPPFDPLTFSKLVFTVFTVIVLLLVIISYKIENSKFGYTLFAIREDRLAAECLGINVFRAKLLATFLSAALTGMVGGIYPVFSLYINPDIAFNIGWSVMLVVMNVFGGLGTWIGSILGAIIFHSVREVFTYFIPIPALSIVFVGAFLMLSILLIPQGIYEKVKSIMVKRGRR